MLAEKDLTDADYVIKSPKIIEAAVNDELFVTASHAFAA